MKKYGPINSIVLSRSAESDNVYLRDEESVTANGLTEIKIIDNQIMNFNNRSEYLQGILDKLDGLTFWINEYDSTGITYYDLLNYGNHGYDGTNKIINRIRSEKNPTFIVNVDAYK